MVRRSSAGYGENEGADVSGFADDVVATAKAAGVVEGTLVLEDIVMKEETSIVFVVVNPLADVANPVADTEREVGDVDCMRGGREVPKATDGETGEGEGGPDLPPRPFTGDCLGGASEAAENGPGS